MVCAPNHGPTIAFVRSIEQRIHNEHRNRERAARYKQISERHTQQIEVRRSVIMILYQEAIKTHVINVRDTLLIAIDRLLQEVVHVQDAPDLVMPENSEAGRAEVVRRVLSGQYPTSRR